MTCSLLNLTCLELPGIVETAGAADWEELVSMGTVGLLTDCFDTTSEAEGQRPRACRDS